MHVAPNLKVECIAPVPRPPTSMLLTLETHKVLVIMVTKIPMP